METNEQRFSHSHGLGEKNADLNCQTAYLFLPFS